MKTELSQFVAARKTYPDGTLCGDLRLNRYEPFQVVRPLKAERNHLTYGSRIKRHNTRNCYQILPADVDRSILFAGVTSGSDFNVGKCMGRPLP
jgi:hypothetical protein